MVLEIKDQSFENEVIKSAMPVVVDFWAPWCGPCHMLGPVIEKLADAYAGKVKFCKINVDENPQISMKYGIMSIPTVLFFKGAQKVDESLGAVPEAMIRPKVESLLQAR